MDFIDEEIGFNKAVYACDSNKVPAVWERELRVPFSQTDETAPCMDGCQFFSIDYSNISFRARNTFSLA